jgi:hypothetical protein
MTNTQAIQKLELEKALTQGLTEYLQELGYDTTTSTIWETRTWIKNTCLSITPTENGWHIHTISTPSLKAINHISTHIPYEEPIENLAHFLKKFQN